MSVLSYYQHNNFLRATVSCYRRKKTVLEVAFLSKKYCYANNGIFWNSFGTESLSLSLSDLIEFSRTKIPVDKIPSNFKFEAKQQQANKRNLLRMAMLMLALILVICSQVAKPLNITVPDDFNGIPGKCDFALDEKHKLKETLLKKGTIQQCADDCRKSDDCASFHFTGQYNGDSEGECVYSSFMCLGNSSISQAKDSKTFRAYITKGTVAWTKSADEYIVSESQKRTFLNQTIYYTEGCCTKDNGKNCTGDKGEAEDVGTTISNSTDCYRKCVETDTCASFRIKWDVPRDLDDETGTCFTSQHACSFTANNQTGDVDAEESKALSYFLVERLTGATEIDVGSGSRRAAAAILAVALAWCILTLATTSIV